MESSVASRLDHLVIVAATLEQGADYCEKVLGISPQIGGEHVRTGTHNRVLGLGDEIYLEVIAINPAATTLTCPRWFGMDHPEQRQRVIRSPYLATFAARTNDIGHAVIALPELGPVRDMQRGTLDWRITIPDDGGLLEGGTLPTVIQWPDGIHPTRAMPDLGCRLMRLEIFHPQPRRLDALWRRIGLRADERLVIQDAKEGGAPRLLAHISTPFGMKTIG